MRAANGQTDNYDFEHQLQPRASTSREYYRKNVSVTCFIGNDSAKTFEKAIADTQT
jgi:hypothetical protein